jgi:cytochrome c-type biogenesis protein CcmH/NrfG
MANKKSNKAQDPSSKPAVAARSASSRWAYIVAGIVAYVVGVTIALGALLPDSSDSAVDNATAPATVDLTTDEVAQAQNLVIANPVDQSARMVRGRELVENGDLGGALDEYMAVLEDGPHAEALAFVGWITYASGEPTLAEQILGESLKVDPHSLTAIWFLANVKYHGTEDTAGALPLLERVLRRPDAEPDMIEAARDMLNSAGSS